MDDLQSEIDGVLIRTLKRYQDARGWLTELFREDELPLGIRPVMSYISVTHPGVGRGPHEHRDQTDVFCFVSGRFLLKLWDRRHPDHPIDETFEVGEQTPALITVPPGVIHGYRNIGATDAFVINLPDRLYAGWGKQQAVDEIRHEEIGSEYEL